MNVSDWVTDRLADLGVRHVFGYQGTMVSYLADAIYRSRRIENHVLYNEQGASLAACGLSQAGGGLGFCYATSGPGAINLLQGVANAHFDSVPLLAVTGQVNTSEFNGTDGLRQRAFQEADVATMAAPVTKSSVSVRTPAEALYEIGRGAALATAGRPGAVLVDIPMDIQRAKVGAEEAKRLLREGAKSVSITDASGARDAARTVAEAVRVAERPLLLLGNGARGSAGKWLAWAEGCRLPIATTLLGRDLIPSGHFLNLGFVGVYGYRLANLTAHRADLIVSVGASLCPRQLRPHEVSARVVRIDVEPEGHLRRWPGAEVFTTDSDSVAEILSTGWYQERIDDTWPRSIADARAVLDAFDARDCARAPNLVLKWLSRQCEEYQTVAVDVGQHMMWAAQSFEVHNGQRLLFSGGHGTMGYALPAAVGAAISTGRPVLCISGDGGMQMNVQELQTVVRESLPVKIVVLNNDSLGLIVDAQNSFLGLRHAGSDEGGGYTVPDFSAVANAYGIDAARVTWSERGRSKAEAILAQEGPGLIQIDIGEGTGNHPKAYMGDPLWNQSPHVPGTECLLI